MFLEHRRPEIVFAGLNAWPPYLAALRNRQVGVVMTSFEDLQGTSWQAIRSVLDAHALPYEVQVIDRGDPALDLFRHLTQHESRRAPTVILLDRTRPPRDGKALGRGLQRPRACRH